MKNLVETEWAKFSHLFERAEVPSKTLLLKEGSVSKKGFWVEQGCLRSWFNNDGKDITFQFFLENQAVSSIESFITGEPSLFNIEAIEPTAVLTISKSNFFLIQSRSEVLKEFFSQQIIRRVFHYQKLFLSRIKDTPIQRYQSLIKESPAIAQRVPQHYIASYLGISTVHFSRIKSKIATGNI